MTNKTTEALKLAEEIFSGMLHGTDWNNGTHANIYRPKFPKALAAIREALADHSGDANKMVADPVFKFLLGEGELEGCGFGEKPEGERGNYWWRKHLRKALAEPEYYDCGGSIGVVHKSQCSASMKRHGVPVCRHGVDDGACKECYVEAVTEPVKQEPEYWEVRNGGCKHGLYWTKEQAEEVRFDMQKAHDLSGSLASFNVRPLYAAPVERQWVDLTDDEIGKAIGFYEPKIHELHIARAAIAKFKEKQL